MTNEFEYLMYLLSCGAKGTKASNPTYDVDFNKVLSLAKEQSVYHTVLYALKLMDNCVLPDSELEVLLLKLKNDAITAYIQRFRVITLLESFEEAGIGVVLLKGYVVASLYALPDSRISGDVDIYVAPEDEKRAQQLLKQNGFNVTSRDKRSHHCLCDHPEIGHLELHVKFYDKIIEDVWFDEKDSHDFVKQPYALVTTDEGSYYTLGKTDNLTFLALHMIKHFIESGMSLRLIMDFCLFFYTNKNDVDLLRFWSTIEKLNYKYLIEVILSISVKYFGFNHNVVHSNINEVDENDINVILNDLETGGFLGVKESDTRDEGWHEYNRVKFIRNKDEKNYKFYMFLWNANGYVKALFPARKYLAKRFSYVKKSVFFVPIAWIHRFFTRGLLYMSNEKLLAFTVNGENDLNDTAKKRVELFKQMKMM